MAQVAAWSSLVERARGLFQWFQWPLQSRARLRARAARASALATLESRIALAGECAQKRLYDEAILLYTFCLQGPYAQDATIRLRLAQALLDAGRYDEARGELEQLLGEHPNHLRHEVRLTYAKSLEATGHMRHALAEYSSLATSYPGEEGRLRYAQLLERLGRESEAREVYEGMLQAAARAPVSYQRAQRDWLREAQAHLETIAERAFRSRNS